MNKLFALSAGLLLCAAHPLPGKSADDVSFLKQLGGKVVKSERGATTMSFTDGTVVVVDGLTITTVDVSGRVYTTDPQNRYFAVNIPGQGVICYPSPIRLADSADASVVLGSR